MVTNKLSPRKTGILFAADLGTLDEALEAASMVCDHVSGIKIGHTLITKYSMNIVSRFKEVCTHPIIADLKILDVAHIAERQAHICFDAGADGLTISGLCGVGPVERLVRRWPDRMILVFNELTHADGLITPELADASARVACAAGAHGIQAPGTRPDRIRHLRKLVGDELVIIACGVGKQGPQYGSAVAAGANYEIIGRSIYLADDPSAEAALASRMIQQQPS